MQIFAENVSLYQNIHHITETSYIQYLISYGNFKFSNSNPFMQIYTKIIRLQKIILAQFVALK